jgi:hypothetical protein
MRVRLVTQVTNTGILVNLVEHVRRVAGTVNVRATAVILATWAPIACASFSAHASKRGPACPPLEVPARLTSPNAVIMLGELHGTEQAPRFVGDLACTLAARGLPVTVALELPVEFSGLLGRLVSDDRPNAAEWQTLFGGTWQDGRRSTAIAALVERLAAMRHAGANMEAASYAPDSAPAQERDDGMSRTLAALAGKGRVLIVLSGNLHNRLRAGTAISAQYRPAGFGLAKLIAPERIVSLDVGYDAGTAWLCASPKPADCGVHHVNARHPAAWGTVTLFDSLDAEGYGGRFGVGAITAAMPAIAK